MLGRFWDHVRRKQEEALLKTAPPVTDSSVATPLHIPSPTDDNDQIELELEYLRKVEARLVRMQSKAEAKNVRIRNV